MDRSVAVPRHLMRLLLSALGVAGGLMVLGLAFGSMSASAQESGTSSDAPPSSNSGTGLLGSVGSLLGTVTAPVSGLTTTATSTVSSMVDPITQALPSPVRHAVAPVTGAVTTVTQSVSVSSVLKPVTGAVDGLVGNIPVVGPTLSTTLGSVSSITGPVTGLLDNTLGDVGTITGTVLGAQPPSDGGGATPPGTSTSVTGTGPATTSDPGSSSVSSLIAGSVPPLVQEFAPIAGSESRTVSGVAREPISPTGSSSVPAAPSEPSGHSPGPNGPSRDSAPGQESAPGSGSSIGAAVSTSPDGVPIVEHAVLFVLTAAGDRLPSTPTFDTDSPPD